MSDLAAHLRERLGLAPDATDDAVTAALEQRLTQPAPPPATPTPDDTTDAPAPAAEPVAASADPALERLVSERVAAAVAPFRDRLEATSTELAARKEADRVAARDALLASAVAAGKIPPADKPKWSELYDKSADSAAAVGQVFASLATGTAVPVAATPGARTGAGEEPAGDGFTDDEYTSLFGDDAKNRAAV